MEVRLSGTPGECRSAVQLLQSSIPERIIRISPFYANKRPGEPKDQGRVYITLELPEA